MHPTPCSEIGKRVELYGAPPYGLRQAMSCILVMQARLVLQQSLAAALPAGCRPAMRKIFATVSSGTAAATIGVFGVNAATADQGKIISD